MNITELSLAGAWVIHPTRHADNRGWFQEWFKKSELKEELIAKLWHPKNYEKFKFYDPEMFGEEDDE